MIVKIYMSAIILKFLNIAAKIITNSNPHNQVFKSLK